MFWYLVGLWGAYSANIAPLTLLATYVANKKAVKLPTNLLIGIKILLGKPPNVVTESVFNALAYDWCLVS